MAKRIDYASMYTLRKDGRYQGWYRDQVGKRHAVYDRDPERLHAKLQEKEAPPALTFRVIAPFGGLWRNSETGRQQKSAPRISSRTWSG